MITVAAVATIAGCIDPEWQSKRPSAKTSTSYAPAAMTDEPVAPVAEDVPAVETSDIRIDDIVLTTAQDPVPSIAEPSNPVIPPPPADANTAYYIRQGDTLSGISKRYNIKLPAILNLNGLNEKSVIRPGQKILLPGAVEVGEQKAQRYQEYTAGKTAGAPRTWGETKTYKIQPNDTLSGIAKKNGTTVADIVELNGLTSDKIRAGRTIKIPVAKGAPAAQSSATKPPVSGKKSEAKPAAKEAKETAKKEDVSGAGADVEQAGTDIDAINSLDSVQAATTPAANDYFIYKVKGGEDITGVSIQFDITPTEIRQLNGLGDDAELTEGMELKLPLSARQ